MRAPEFWYRDDAVARFASAALAPLAVAYAGVTLWKQHHARPFRSRATVICVGNLTAGGSGKTPVAIALVKLLQERALRVTVLSRGYGGRLSGPLLVNPDLHSAADIGDEPLMLARIAPVVVSRDRAEGAALADADGTDVVVMDDGHQNFTLVKDLSIVVVDAERGFGNTCVIPAGPLREPVRDGLARADAVVLVGAGSPDLADFSGPVVRAKLTPCGGGNWMGRRAIAFAGIGRPAKFFKTLEVLGTVLVDRICFADHHPYSAVEIARLKERAARENSLLVTTEKDFMRLSADQREGIAYLPVEAEFDNPDILSDLIAKTRRP